MLKGKTALVTGSTSGIGLGIARALGGAGANVDAQRLRRRRRDRGAARRSSPSEYGVKVAYSGADMSQAGRDRGHGRARRRRSSAGSTSSSTTPASSTSRRCEDFPAGPLGRGARDQPVVGVPRHRRRRCRGCRSASWGRIVNIASAHGLVASAHKSAYVAAKHGLVGLTKAVALETATTGITCNAICPGWVLTPLVQKQIDARAKRGRHRDRAGQGGAAGREAALRRVRHARADRRPGVFLCSEAAAQIRGAAVPVDGGWTAQ